jgi:CheY-like chemotaxis protein
MRRPMALNVRDTVPPRHEPASVLLARASEFRRMAASAGSSKDMRALDDLAVRFTALAHEREFEERMAILQSGTLSGLPSPQALKLATEAVRRSFSCPDVLQHPVVASSIRRLAYQLMAYGLVPAEPAVETAASKPRPAGQHVLVVDDTADVLVAVGAFLVSEGFVVVSAGDGDKALRLIAGDPEIGILITDYVMPGLSGVDLITQATQMRPDLRALLITGYPNADGLAELPSHIKILTKPFRRSALISQVRALVTEAPPMLPDEAMELVENRPPEKSFYAAVSPAARAGD